MRVLFLCTHNSARSQMAEGWLRRHAGEAGLAVEACSAGTVKTTVRPEAVEVMREVGIDLSAHVSKTLYELPDPWGFDLVMTVCDEANAVCPTYPAATRRLHLSVPDPSGAEVGRWREVRDVLEAMSLALVHALGSGRAPTPEELGTLTTRRRGER